MMYLVNVTTKNCTKSNYFFFFGSNVQNLITILNVVVHSTAIKTFDPEILATANRRGASRSPLTHFEIYNLLAQQFSKHIYFILIDSMCIILLCVTVSHTCGFETQTYLTYQTLSEQSPT